MTNVLTPYAQTANVNEAINDGVNDVVYTEDEIDDNDALVVRAKSDGDHAIGQTSI